MAGVYNQNPKLADTVKNDMFSLKASSTGHVLTEPFIKLKRSKPQVWALIASFETFHSSPTGS
jgi:hypothetical protein